jgi:hypothetical protein
MVGVMCSDLSWSSLCVSIVQPKYTLGRVVSCPK